MDFRRNIVRSWMINARKKIGFQGFNVFQFSELLIICWIVFEAYACDRYALRGVQARIDAFVREHEEQYSNDFENFSGLFRENLDHLSRYSITDMTPISRGQTAKPSIQITDEKNLSGVMAGVYSVRNNLFHGGKDIESERDRRIIEYASLVLFGLLDRFLPVDGYQIQ